MDWGEAASLVWAVAAAARSFDKPGAEAASAAIIARVRATDVPFPLDGAKLCLAELREARLFDQMQTLAETFLTAGHDDTLRINRQYAQALLDRGSYPAALLVLQRLLAKSTGDPNENREARGLFGRAFKQLYIDGHAAPTRRAATHLATAIDWYHDVFRNDPTQVWHGINAAALLMRAQRDGVDVAAGTDPRQVAETVLQAITAIPAEQRTAWDKATAGEASIALGRAEEAVEWMQGYVAAPDVTAFAIAGTLRQLTEIWGLDLSHRIGRIVIPWMQAWILERAGGCVELTHSDLQREAAPTRGESAATYEALLSNADVVSLDWYKLGLERCRSVARIEDLNGVDDDVGVGTGFLIRGSDLCKNDQRMKDRWFVLTNAHVVSADDPSALRPDQVRLSFKALSPGGPVQASVRGVAFSSPRVELDATLLEIDPLSEPSLQPYPLAIEPPLRNVQARVYIIGHPNGGRLSFSINDNVLLDYDDRYLHYRAPTEGGSSGSPVFNQKWQLVALHHAGGTDVPRLNGQAGRYATNEGIWIQRVRAAICAKLAGA